MMTDQPELLTSIEDGIARITFNRPHARNALTGYMVDTMREFLKTVEHDPAVRCVIITGAGDHFMAGGDVKAFNEVLDMDGEARRRHFEIKASNAVGLFAVMERLPKPIIAKIRGACAGAAVGWAAAADFVLVSDTALFLVAHIKLGTSPDGAVTWHLPRVVGLRKAKEMAMLGDRVLAEEAVAIGLANRMVPDAELDAETEKLARRLAEGPTVAIGRTKQLLNVAAENTLQRQMQLEAEGFGACAVTDDFIDGMRSFAEKRAPVFKGV